MSTGQFDTGLEVVQPGRDGAFEARMQEVRRQREQRTTEVFEVPGFESIIKVELRVLGYKKTTDVAIQHVRQRDDSLRALYTAADQLLAATVAFHKIQADGSLEAAEGLSWLQLAQAYDPSINATVRPRTALIRLLDDGKGVNELHGAWYSWNTRGNEKVDGELEQDFPEMAS
jgi:hypothetical protein